MTSATNKRERGGAEVTRWASLLMLMPYAVAFGAIVAVTLLQRWLEGR